MLNLDDLTEKGVHGGDERLRRESRSERLVVSLQLCFAESWARVAEGRRRELRNWVVNEGRQLAG